MSPMRLADLQQALEHLEIPPGRYSLTGGMPEDGFGIKRQGQRWIVYYSERGSRFEVERFDDEDTACRRLWTLVTDGR